MCLSKVAGFPTSFPLQFWSCLGEKSYLKDENNKISKCKNTLLKMFDHKAWYMFLMSLNFSGVVSELYYLFRELPISKIT